MTHIAEKTSPSGLSFLWYYFEIQVRVGHETVEYSFNYENAIS